MPTASDVAEWMCDEVKQNRYLTQVYAVRTIQERFGDEFVYRNKNRNLAIKKNVLDRFKTLTKEEVVWSRGHRHWRLREPFDPPGKRQVKY